MILTKPSIDPIILSLGFVDIRWYSLAYLFGFIFGSLLIKYINKKLLNTITNKQIDSFFIWAVIGVILVVSTWPRRLLHVIQFRLSGFAILAKTTLHIESCRVDSVT